MRSVCRDSRIAKDQRAEVVAHEANVGGFEAQYVRIDFEEPVRRAARRIDEQTRFFPPYTNFFVPELTFDTIVLNESLDLFRDVAQGDAISTCKALGTPQMTAARSARDACEVR